VSDILSTVLSKLEYTHTGALGRKDGEDSAKMAEERCRCTHAAGREERSRCKKRSV